MAFYDEKGWWKSRTIWGALVAVVFSALGFFDVTAIAGMGPDTIVDTIMQIVAAIGAVFAIYGRIKAEKAIAPNIVPTTDDKLLPPN